MTLAGLALASLGGAWFKQSKISFLPVSGG
jgi:hypothetical protein